jgi:hypothetical protein
MKLGKPRSQERVSSKVIGEKNVEENILVVYF